MMSDEGFVTQEETIIFPQKRSTLVDSMDYQLQTVIDEKNFDIKTFNDRVSEEAEYTAIKPQSIEDKKREIVWDSILFIEGRRQTHLKPDATSEDELGLDSVVRKIISEQAILQDKKAAKQEFINVYARRIVFLQKTGQGIFPSAGETGSKFFNILNKNYSINVESEEDITSNLAAEIDKKILELEKEQNHIQPGFLTKNN